MGGGKGGGRYKTRAAAEAAAVTYIKHIIKLGAGAAKKAAVTRSRYRKQAAADTAAVTQTMP
jgi:hypothetical protein